MSRKVIESKSTGIYRRKRYPPITLKTKKGKFSIRDLKSFEKLTRQHIEGFDLKRLLGRLEAAGKRVIKAHGGKLKLKERLPSGAIREAIFWVREEAPPIAHDASDLLWEIVSLRHSIKENHVENAALHAFRLGRIAERINVRPFEAAVKTGFQSRKGFQQLREAKGRKYSKAAVGWQTEANRMIHINPNLKWTTVCNKIADRSGKSGLEVVGRTVRNRTKDPRKLS